MQKIYVCSCRRYLYSPPYDTAVCPQCNFQGLNPHTKKSTLDYYYYFPVIGFLQMFWQKFPSWAKSCYYPWADHEPKAGEMSDIYDTPGWKKHQCLQRAGNMGFILNADGMAIFKSSKSSLWPIWLMNANLPPKIRL